MYAMPQEADRQGSLKVDRALALGLEPGSGFNAIKEGLTVKVNEWSLFRFVVDMCWAPAYAFLGGNE
jgi:hypothetical protein